MIVEIFVNIVGILVMFILPDVFFEKIGYSLQANCNISTKKISAYKLGLFLFIFIYFVLLLLLIWAL